MTQIKIETQKLLETFDNFISSGGINECGELPELLRKVPADFSLEVPEDSYKNVVDMLVKNETVIRSQISNHLLPAQEDNSIEEQNAITRESANGVQETSQQNLSHSPESTNQLVKTQQVDSSETQKNDLSGVMSEKQEINRQDPPFDTESSKNLSFLEVIERNNSLMLKELAQVEHERDHVQSHHNNEILSLMRTHQNEMLSHIEAVDRKVNKRIDELSETIDNVHEKLCFVANYVHALQTMTINNHFVTNNRSNIIETAKDDTHAS